MTHYVPFIRRVIAHYLPEKRDDDGALEQILFSLKNPESSLFGSIEAAPERYFLCELRQEVLRLTRGCELRDVGGTGDYECGPGTADGGRQAGGLVRNHALWCE